MADAIEHDGFHLGLRWHRTQPGHDDVSDAVTDSHRTPSGIGAETTRRNTGEPGRSARTISTNGSTPAQGDPPNGEPRVMTVSTRPLDGGRRWPAR